jgi:hypothetical protein
VNTKSNRAQEKGMRIHKRNEKGMFAWKGKEKGLTEVSRRNHKKGGKEAMRVIPEIYEIHGPVTLRKEESFESYEKKKGLPYERKKALGVTKRKRITLRKEESFKKL